MKLLLQRERSQPWGTPGRLYVETGPKPDQNRTETVPNPGKPKETQPEPDQNPTETLSTKWEPECFTVEDVVRTGPKVPHETAIPPGTYGVVINHSPRFGKVLPQLLDVPNFVGIRIHAGNHANPDSSGCILVGLGRSATGVTRSRDAMNRLQPQIAEALARGQRVEIEVRNA